MALIQNILFYDSNMRYVLCEKESIGKPNTIQSKEITLASCPKGVKFSPGMMNIYFA